jgi:hypothetical protein
VTDDARPEEKSRLAIRLPRLGLAASIAASLLLTSSLVVVTPIGLLIAPLALVPVAQWVAADPRRAALGWGSVSAALAALSVAGLSLLSSPAWGYLVAYVLVVGLPAASLAVWRRSSWSEGRWAAVTTLVATAACLAALVLAASPRPPVDALAGWFGEAATRVEASYREVGVPTGELELAFDTVGPAVPWVAPSLPIAYLIVVLFWIRPRLPMLGFPMGIEPFERYRGDEWLPLGFAVFGIGTLVLAGTPRWLATNLLIAVLMLYFVQGLAMIRAHVARWVGRGWLVRWAVVLLCVQGPLPLVVAAIGIADGFYSLRPRATDDGGNP